ncbi:MAG: CCA tRNA nucleotidyltransferase [Corynebacterium sp.]|nr:CCA tRNA nucleotidyltransferase [Corynebacterium sp.]
MLDELAGLLHAPLYLVGGSVRDLVLGKDISDLDFTTILRPDEVLDALTAWADATWETGVEFGTVALEKNGVKLEITTFRADLYDGVTRNPEVQFGTTLDDDLVRRDFTVNAMALEIVPGGEPVFHDPLGGLSALAAGVLDTPQAPEVSFRDDPLRMLRAARFLSQLGGYGATHAGFTVAERVVTAMTAMAGEIERITAERIQAELDKMMLGVRPEAGIELLVSTGLADFVLPDVAALKAVGDEHGQHKDIYQHSLTVLRQAIDQEEEPDLILRWAALLHDIGKPATRKYVDGAVTFHQHEIVGARLVRTWMRRLKYPKHMTGDVSELVALHMRFHGFGDGEWTDSAVRRYVTDAGELLPRLNKLVRADSTTRNKRKAAWIQRSYDELEARIADLKAREDLAKVRPDLDGNEIMEILGVPAGPIVGRAWKYLKDVRLNRGPLDHDEAIAVLQAWWKEQQ